MQNMDAIVPVIGNMVHQGTDGNQSVIDKAGIDGVEDADSLVVVRFKFRYSKFSLAHLF